MSEDRRTQAPRTGSWSLYAATSGLLGVFAVLAGVFVGPEFALPIVVLAVVVMAFFAVNDVAARRNLERHDGDPLAAQDDETEPVPTAHVIPDETALGDTAEAHAELSPVDLPPDAPGRKAAEAQAAKTGTTRGNDRGAAGGQRLKDADAPPSKTEGYERDRPVSSPHAR